MNTENVSDISPESRNLNHQFYCFLFVVVVVLSVFGENYIGNDEITLDHLLVIPRVLISVK